VQREVGADVLLASRPGRGSSLARPGALSPLLPIQQGSKQVVESHTAIKTHILVSNYKVSQVI